MAATAFSGSIYFFTDFIKLKDLYIDILRIYGYNYIADKISDNSLPGMKYDKNRKVVCERWQ